MITDHKISKYTFVLLNEALLMGLSQQAITLLQPGTVTLLFNGYYKKSDEELTELPKSMIHFLCQGDTSFLQFGNMILGHICDTSIF